jgi:MFS family permease
VLTSVLQAALLVPLLFINDTGELWILYLVTAAEAALAAMFESVKNVTLSTLVAEEQLVSANASIGLNATMGRLIGSPLGGLLLGLEGLPYVVAFGSGAFLITAVLSWSIPSTTDKNPDAELLQSAGFWHSLGDGLRTIWGVPALRNTTLCIGLLSVAQGMFVVLFLLFVTGLLHGGDTQAGVLRGVQAIGGFVGSLTAGLLTRRLGAPRLLSLGLLAFGLISAAAWNLSLASPGFWVFVVLFSAAGAPGVWLAAAWLSLVQHNSAPEVRGRVMGSILGLFDGLQALGMFAAGLLAGAVDTVVALDVQAGLILGTAALCARLLHRLG